MKACGGKQAIRRILVASNGMAAAKVMMSMRQWAHMEANLGSEGILEFVAMATKDDLDVPRLGQTRRCLRRTRSSFDWQTSMWRCLRARTCLEKHAAEQAKGDILLVSFLADFCRA